LKILKLSWGTTSPLLPCININNNTDPYQYQYGIEIFILNGIGIITFLYPIPGSQYRE